MDAHNITAPLPEMSSINDELKAYAYDTSASLRDMLDLYDRSKEVQTLSFRKLVSWVKVGERATHYIHPYPAKLLPQIAHFFLAAKSHFGSGLRVLDPFGGSGTVALETILSGNKAFYSDANPLARNIAKVKTTIVDTYELKDEFVRIEERYKRSRTRTRPDVVNLEKWFSHKSINCLIRLKSSIEECDNADVRAFYLIVFSAVSKKVSNADPRLSVPVIRKNIDVNESVDVFKIFLQQSEASISRMRDFIRLSTGRPIVNDVGTDARCMKSPKNWGDTLDEPLQSQSIDLIITSPPYAGAQKYIRASSLSLGWLGLAGSSGLKTLENQNIGREHLPKSVWGELISTSVGAANDVIERVRKVNPLRAAIAATYLNEMEHCFKEMSRVLVDDGHLILVIGNNEVCGEKFLSSAYLTSIAKSFGLEPILEAVDEIKSRGLMTKRNRTAGIISLEWVIVFRKLRGVNAHGI